MDHIDEPGWHNGAAPHHPPPHPLPTQANRQAAEARWPETAQLVHPARGAKWSLLAQNDSIQAILRDTVPLVFRHIASVDSFPSGEVKVKVIRDSLYQAAKDGSFDAISTRLSRDRDFGRWLGSLVRTTRLTLPSLTWLIYRLILE